MSRLKFLAIVCALGAAACSDPTTPTQTTTPITVTDNFVGALTKNGATSYSFTTATSGTVIATLSSLGPDATTLVGLGLGTWNGSACQIILANDRAIQGSVVLGAASSAGSLCVRIYDIGNVTDLVSYQIQVAHP